MLGIKIIRQNIHMFHSHHTSKTWPKPTSVPCENKKISTKSVEAYICSYSKLYMSVGVV